MCDCVGVCDCVLVCGIVCVVSVWGTGVALQHCTCTCRICRNTIANALSNGGGGGGVWFLHDCKGSTSHYLPCVCVCTYPVMNCTCCAMYTVHVYHACANWGMCTCTCSPLQCVLFVFRFCETF